MMLSMETGWLRRRFDDETAIRLIKEAGFDAFDYSFYYAKDQQGKDMLCDDYLQRAYTLKEHADSLGIVCNQTHAPLDFDHADEISLKNENYLRNVRAIEVSSVLGAKSIVVHSVGSVLRSNLDYFDYNINYLKSYIPYCEKYKMHISVENLHTYDDNKNAVGIKGLTTAQEHIDYIKKLDSEWFNICLDTGHTAVCGVEPDDMIMTIGNKLLKALHIHDTDKIKDRHWLPYSGSINWEKVTDALGKIGYDGDFTMEAINFFAGVPDELVEASLKYACTTGRFLMNKILYNE